MSLPFPGFSTHLIPDLSTLILVHSVRAAVDKLRQQFFLAMIEGYANIHDWDAALKVVMEAFHHVSTALQKPLWQWRVITLSKKGKSVLDGIQKLKESDPSLQAQVYGILARASSNVQQQQESYQKAIEVGALCTGTVCCVCNVPGGLVMGAVFLALAGSVYGFPGSEQILQDLPGSPLTVSCILLADRMFHCMCATI